MYVNLKFNVPDDLNKLFEYLDLNFKIYISDVTQFSYCENIREYNIYSGDLIIYLIYILKKDKYYIHIWNNKKTLLSDELLKEYSYSEIREIIISNFNLFGELYSKDTASLFSEI